MMQALLVCLLACAFTASHALVGKTCLTESECDAGECCQILSEYMVVSRRDADLLKPILATMPPKQAENIYSCCTCQMYKVEGPHCNGFEKMNGYCGCGPGLECHTYERPLPTAVLPTTTVQIKTRSMVAPRPGYEWVSQCEKI